VIASTTPSWSRSGARMQTELLNTRKVAHHLELTLAMTDYIDNFYNLQRRHSYLGNLSPADYEKLWHDIQPSPQLS
jgi:putative transposase